MSLACVRISLLLYFSTNICKKFLLELGKDAWLNYDHG